MKLAIVEWVDSMGGNVWEDMDMLRSYGLASIFSVGWVMKQTSEFIHLLSSYSPYMDKGGQTMIIPKGCVVKVKYVGSKFTIKEG